jgi:flagellar hook-associated protein 3 FlgL
MRISTAEQFQNGINAIQTQQVQMSRTQQQLATGRRLLAPSDDPAAAVQALGLRDGLAALDQYSRNAEGAIARLSQQETVLADMGLLLQRARELTVQAANGVQNDESRAAIASELEQITESLLAAANTRDANGEYLFAGHRSDRLPFARGADGSVTYFGDDGERRVAVSADRSITVGANGRPLMEVSRGNGAYLVDPAAGNQGTARVVSMELSAGPVAADRFSIHFTAADAYEVRDVDDNVVAAGVYEPDRVIDVDGRAVVLSGAPAAGDVFEITPAGRGSVFTMLDDLVAALSQPGGDAAAVGQIQHRASTGLLDLDQALEALLQQRTALGGRLNAVELQLTQNDDQRLRLQTRLSEVEDLDYAEAVSRFQLQQVALQAAQQAYVQLSRLSLFDYLR